MPPALRSLSLGWEGGCAQGWLVCARLYDVCVAWSTGRGDSPPPPPLLGVVRCSSSSLGSLRRTLRGRRILRIGTRAPSNRVDWLEIGYVGGLQSSNITDHHGDGEKDVWSCFGCGFGVRDFRRYVALGMAMAVCFALDLLLYGL